VRAPRPQDRAKKKIERTREGEKWRLKGNEAMAEGMPGKAFKLYTRGLDEDKGSKLLLLNRALAALRLKNKQVTVVKLGEDTLIDSYESAIADCTRFPLLPTVSPPRESTLRDG